MQGYLLSLSYKTWKAVEKQYVKPMNGMNTPDEIEAYEENEKAIDAIFNSLLETELTKVVSLETAHHVWEKQICTCEGDDMVKQSNQQNVKVKYECLQMEEDDNITSYLQQIDDVVNEIQALGGDLKKNVVQNLLRTLTKPYSSKVSAIEESHNLSKYTREQMYGSLFLR